MNPVQIPSFMSIGTTDVEKSLMHSLDKICIDSVVVKGVMQKKVWSCLMWAYFELLRLY